MKTSMMHPYTIDVDTIRCGPRGDPTFRWRPQGCPYNNVVDESTNRILKAKLVHREAFGTTRELRAKLSDYVHWYNNFRIHSTLGYMSPIEFREAGLSLPKSSK